MRIPLMVLFAAISGTLLTGTAASQQGCAIDVSDLTAASPITGKVANTGQTPFNASYLFSVNGKQVGNGTLPLQPGEAQDITNAFSFGTGTFTVVLSATASCGASDTETIVHTILEPFACTNPFGVSGQNFCLYASQEYQVCRSNQWQTLDKNGQQYCINCQFTCGDGACNCGESLGTCAQDCSCPQGFVNQFQCSGNIQQQLFQFSDCSSEWRPARLCSSGCNAGQCAQVCRERFLPDYACSGNVRQQKFVSANCTESFVPLEFCQSGCQGGLCLPGGPATGCGVSIGGLDFVRTLGRLDKGYATVTVKNTGSKDTITLTFSVDGNQRDRQTFLLESEREATRTFFYTFPEGTHLADITARRSCGAEDTENFQFTVTGEAKAISFQSPTPPPAPSPATAVTILPPTLDIPLYTGKAVSADIITSRPQNFIISVTGLPASFVSYTSPVFVQTSSRAFIYITPTQPGSYRFTVSVTAESEGKAFSRGIDLFVTPPAAGAPGRVQPPFDTILFALAAIVIVALTVGTGILVSKKRKETYWGLVMKRALARYRPRATQLSQPRHRKPQAAGQPQNRRQQVYRRLKETLHRQPKRTVPIVWARANG